MNKQKTIRINKMLRRKRLKIKYKVSFFTVIDVSGSTLQNGPVDDLIESVWCVSHNLALFLLGMIVFRILNRLLTFVMLHRTCWRSRRPSSSTTRWWIYTAFGDASTNTERCVHVVWSSCTCCFLRSCARNFGCYDQDGMLVFFHLNYCMKQSFKTISVI